MQLVALWIHTELFPHRENVEKSVVRSSNGISVLELEAVVLETEHLHLAVVEVGVKLGVRTREALLIHVAPNRRHERLIADTVKAVGQHLAQVLLHSENGHSIQVGQDDVHHHLLFLTRKGIVVELVALLLAEHVDRNSEHGRVNKHQHTLVVVL